MGIRDMPAHEDGFARLLDDDEAAHFARTDGGRAVADATLTLLATFPPRAGMHLRALAEARMAPRTDIINVAGLPEVRSYPDDFDLARLGTFG